MKLTTPGKILLTLFIAAILGAGYYFFAPNKDGENTAFSTEKFGFNKNNETTTEDNMATDDNVATDEATSSASSSSTSGSSRSFSYSAPVPVEGKLKGVVELGASGFNSFIVNIDKQKNWKLEHAEFNNSLVLENMATDYDIRSGLKKYIGSMLDHGVSGKDIHFVVSSGALKADVTQKIISVLKSMGYFVNTVTPEEEGRLALKCVLPASFEDKAFVVDIGSGNTKISWKANSSVAALETYGSKYYDKGTDPAVVYEDAKAKAKQIPASKTQVCFIIGGVPFEMAKEIRKGKERYTVLNAPDAYKSDKAKTKAGVNIYKAIADGTGCKQFVFDWDANFTIGFLLGLK
ncbi:MAG: hypothetical protein ACK4GN_11085 [Runella sp.]